MLRAADKDGAVAEALLPLLQVCFKTGTFTAVCVPLAKSKDREAPATDYRMIALLSIIGKIYENLIEKRIATMVEQQRNVPGDVGEDDIKPLAEEQNGFRHDKRSCNDAAWLLSGVIRANGRRKKKTYVAYLDIKKAYPKTNHAILLNAVWNQGIRGPLYATIESHLRDRKHKILVNGVHTESYDVSVGLAEGSLLSPVLFSIFINSIVTEINTVGEGVVLGTDSGKFQIRFFCTQMTLP